MGYQLPSARAHHAQKQSPVQLSVGLAVNVEREVLQPMDGLPANIGQDVSNGFPVSHCRNHFQKDLPSVQLASSCEQFRL